MGLQVERSALLRVFRTAVASLLLAATGVAWASTDVSSIADEHVVTAGIEWCKAPRTETRAGISAGGCRFEPLLAGERGTGYFIGFQRESVWLRLRLRNDSTTRWRAGCKRVLPERATSRSTSKPTAASGRRVGSGTTCRGLRAMRSENASMRWPLRCAASLARHLHSHRFQAVDQSEDDAVEACGVDGATAFIGCVDGARFRWSAARFHRDRADVRHYARVAIRFLFGRARR